MRAVVTVVVATEVVRAKRELSCRERKAVQKKEDWSVTSQVKEHGHVTRSEDSTFAQLGRQERSEIKGAAAKGCKQLPTRAQD